jgi:hypothetical protein
VNLETIAIEVFALAGVFRHDHDRHLTCQIEPARTTLAAALARLEIQAQDDAQQDQDLDDGLLSEPDWRAEP